MAFFNWRLMCTVVSLPKNLIIAPKKWYNMRRKRRISPFIENEQPKPNTNVNTNDPVSSSAATTSGNSGNIMKNFTLSDFTLVSLVGRGGFGKVFLAEDKQSKRPYAIKVVRKDRLLRCQSMLSIMTERNVLALGITSPFIANIYSTFTTPSHLFFLMEYLNGGDLRNHLLQSQTFDLDRARFYAAEITVGLQFLHNNGIVYRYETNEMLDLKLDNVLLDSEGHIKLTDFGLSHQVTSPSTALTDRLCGTWNYVAPEMILKFKYSYTVDWWAFGVLCYEMLIGKQPFHGNTRTELFHNILGSNVRYPGTLDGKAIRFLTALLKRNQFKRLGCTENTEPIRSSTFFDSINWNEIELRNAKPPFIPNVVNPEDTSNFRQKYTQEPPVISNVQPDVINSINQNVFSNFSFNSPHTHV